MKTPPMDSSTQPQLQQSCSKPSTSPPRNEGRVVSPKPQSTPTSIQIDYLIRYLELNPYLVNNKCDMPRSRQDSTTSWEKLAENLNRLSKTTTRKDAETWRTIWSAQKRLVKQKVDKVSTQDFIHLREQLNDRDRRILSLADSSDDEDDSPTMRRTVQEKSTPSERATTPRASDTITEADVHSPNLENPPRSPSTSVYSDEELRNILEGFSDADIDAMREVTIKKTPSVRLTPLTSSQLASMRSSKCDKTWKRRKSMAACGNERAAKPAPRQSRIAVPTSSRITPSRAQDSGYETRTPRIKKSHKQSRTKRPRVTGPDFVPLGERRAACMEDFARAMKRMAENDRQRNEILRTTLEREKNYAEKHSAAVLLLLKDCLELLKKK